MPSNEWLLITVGAILVNNVVLSRILGICPFLGVSKKLETALGMSGAVTFVLTISSFVTAVLYKLLLSAEITIFGITVNLSFTKFLLFIVVIASLVQIIEILLRKFSPALYRALGIYLPLITTNCAVLGVALTNVQNGYSFIESVFAAFGTAVGYTIAIVLLAGIRSRFDEESMPAPLRGAPVVMIAAALMSIAFMGFSDLAF